MIQYLETLVFVVAVYFYHIYFHNRVTKSFLCEIFGFEKTKRPDAPQKASPFSLEHLGMPSGHTEATAVALLMLYYLEWIPLWVAVLGITIMALQRVLWNRHSGCQVFVGGFFGVLYGMLFQYLGGSKLFYTILIIVITIAMSMVVISKIDYRIKNTRPAWLSMQMEPDLIRKRNVPYHLKFLCYWVAIMVNDCYYASWKEVEEHLDEIIEKVKLSGYQIDAVVGIKTGGAFLSEYIAQKLGVKEYKIKLREIGSVQDIDPGSVKQIYNTYKRQLMYKSAKKFALIEGIDDNIEGESVLIIDEMSGRGTTMREVINYLKNTKNVGLVYPFCISFCGKRWFREDFDVNFNTEETVTIWPWGYDN